jgi:N-acetylneuraminic acid mutarotase
VDVVLDATGQSQGDYSTDLVINNNDPDDDPVTVPVTMHVTMSGTNTSPTLAGLPDQQVPMNGSADNAIDLWAYADDAEDADGDMTFAIINSPTISAGVSLDANRYIDINPATDWSGVTDVVVQVQDTGGLTDTDTLQVTVGDVPNIRFSVTSFEETLPQGGSIVKTLTISNTGTASLAFEIREMAGTFTPTAITLSAPDNTGLAPLVPALTTASVLADKGRPNGQTVTGVPASLLAPEDIGTAWEVMTPLPSARAFNAVVAAGGYVYVIGGTSDADGAIPTNTNVRYDTQTNTWDTMTAMPASLSAIDGVAINGKIYIPGSDDASDSNTYVYDIAADSWSTIAANGGYAAPSHYQVVAIGTDLYVLGGVINSASTTDVWVLDTTAETWSSGVPMQNSRISFSAVAINDNIYVAGGVAYPGFAPDMTAEMFDGASWSYVANVPDGGGAYTRWSYNADGHGEDGLWLAAGRRDTDWDVVNHAGYYDPMTNSWSDSPTIPALNQGRVYMEGAVATDGYFYVIGGRNPAGDVAYDTNERLLVGHPGEDVPWLSEDPISGTVAAGGSVGVDVTLDATGLALGDYGAKLVVKSDDPDQDRATLPVLMHVATINTPPTLTGLPDQQVAVNGSADDAIDLWAYASDTQDADSDMTFSIVNSPLVSAGVSLDANRYIDVNPATDWSGVTDVVVQVQDTGGLTDTDTFQVTITETITFANVTVSVSGNQFCAGRSNGVERCFDVDSDTAISATVRFYFTEAERNGQTLDDLVVFHYAGGWPDEPEPGPYTRGSAGDAQYVEAQNVSGFSLFALDVESRGGLVYMPLLIQRYPPIPDTPVLNAISNTDGDGNYTVDWESAHLASTYTLQEDDNASFSSPTTQYNGASTSWSASGKATGTYYYRVRASNSWGDSGWSTVRSVKVSPPTTFYPVADTVVFQGAGGANLGGYSDMEAGYDHCYGLQIARSLIKFDLSSIPAGTPITRARLYLYLFDSCDLANRTHTITAYRSGANWAEMTVTWNNKPGYAEARGSTTVSSRTPGWYVINVTDLVRGWVNNSFPNHGLMLRGPEGSGDSSAMMMFYTRESSSHDPYLSIEYAGMARGQESVPSVGEVSVLPECGSTVKDLFGLSSTLGYSTFAFVEQADCPPGGQLEIREKQP